ncbi:MAG: hypothetical protein ACE5H7_05290 [Acidiferrobacterales bacterium]
MNWLHQVSRELSDGARAELIYAGKILVFKDVPAIKALRIFSDTLIRKSLDPHDPEKAQFSLSRNVYLPMVAALQQRYQQHSKPTALFATALQEVGVDLGRTYWDKLHLRILPHGGTHAGGQVSKIGFHRDTWGSNLHQQTNWWAPIYPLTAERTIAFYPYYWSHGVQNTSGSWSIREFVARRKAAQLGEPVGYPSAPEPSEPVDTSSELRVVVQPGDILCFSSAQLHASVSNTSGRARFSIETRTVNIDDMHNNRGAPNVDCAGTEIMTTWFRHIEDNRSLADAVAFP